MIGWLPTDPVAYCYVFWGSVFGGGLKGGGRRGEFESIQLQLDTFKIDLTLPGF